MMPAVAEATTSRMRVTEPYRPTLLYRIIEARLEEAARALKRMRMADDRFLGRMRCLWPDTLPEAFDVWVGYNRHQVRAKPDRPTGAQIDRMDEMIDLMTCLAMDRLPASKPGDLNQILWMRCGHSSWREIIRVRRKRWRPHKPPLGNHNGALKHWYRTALQIVEREVLAQGRDLVLPDDWVEERMLSRRY